MAEVKISDLTAAVSVAGADLIPVVQGGVTKKATASLAPVSTPQQTALDLKANLASPTFTGTVTLPSGQALVAPALGTPVSGVATNLTGTASGLTAGTASAVAVGGITGLGSNVATALAVAVGSAGGPVVLNGAGGTPSSLTGTNISGTAASLTAGKATNAAGGSGGTVLYQSAADTTAFLANGTAGYRLKAGGGTAAPSWAAIIRTVTANFYNNGSVLTTGKAIGYFTFPHAGTITGWSISADAGTATLDVWKIAAGTAVPTVSNKITSSGVALASGTSIRSTTVTDFGANTAVTLGDIIAVNLTTVATATQLTFELEITLT